MQQMTLMSIKNIYKTIKKRKQSNINEQKTLTDTFKKKISEGPITKLKDIQYHWSRGYRLKSLGVATTHPQK